MLARRLTTILPAMTLAEALETMRIHRVAGLTGDRTAWVTTRPCRAPHQTISDVGPIGGGQVPMPGEVSRVLQTSQQWLYRQHGWRHRWALTHHACGRRGSSWPRPPGCGSHLVARPSRSGHDRPAPPFSTLHAPSTGVIASISLSHRWLWHTAYWPLAYITRHPIVSPSTQQGS
jgi:hypothetical protein